MISSARLSLKYADDANTNRDFLSCMKILRRLSNSNQTFDFCGISSSSKWCEHQFGFLFYFCWLLQQLLNVCFEYDINSTLDTGACWWCESYLSIFTDSKTELRHMLLRQYLLYLPTTVVAIKRVFYMSRRQHAWYCRVLTMQVLIGYFSFASTDYSN